MTVRMAAWVKWALAAVAVYLILKDPGGTADWLRTTAHSLSTFVNRL